MEKVNFFYGELLVNSDCNIECGMKCQYKNKANGGPLEWSEAKKTLEEYSDVVDFEYIGISGGEPLNHPTIHQFIYGMRQLYKNSTIIFITDGMKLPSDNSVINCLIESSPSKLCIVLQKDWYDLYAQLDSVIGSLEFRFVKINDNNPTKGIKYILFKKNVIFDMELYIHIPVKFKTVNLERLFDFESIFPYCHGRKSMPVLSDSKIFKCRNAKRLWDYSREGITTLAQYQIDEMLVDAVVNNRREVYKLEKFNKKSKICALCQGCIECIVYPKGSINDED